MIKLGTLIAGIVFWISSSNSYATETFELIQTSKFIIKTEDPKLGGLSALHLSNFGKDFVAISDKGNFFKGTLTRDKTGNIVNIKISQAGILLKSDGEPVNKRNTDSEGLAALTSDKYYISFESNHRIMFHRSLESAGSIIEKHPDFQNFEFNKGIEAIAINVSGELFAIPEKPPRQENRYPLYRYMNKKWDIVTNFPADGPFLVTDADFLSDNSLIVLERDHNWATGFRTRIRRISFVNDKVTKIDILLETKASSANNEGLSIWYNSKNQPMITIISDNNFLPFIDTELTEYKLVILNDIK